MNAGKLPDAVVICHKLLWGERSYARCQKLHEVPEAVARSQNLRWGHRSCGEMLEAAANLLIVYFPLNSINWNLGVKAGFFSQGWVCQRFNSDMILEAAIGVCIHEWSKIQYVKGVKWSLIGSLKWVIGPLLDLSGFHSSYGISRSNENTG